MRYLSFLFVLFFFLGAGIPEVSVKNSQLNIHFIATAHAGQSANAIILSDESPAPSPKLQEKPHFGKIWKEKLKAMNPFKTKGDTETIALILAFFLGNWGAHKFYLGDKKGGFTMLGITISGYALYMIAYILGVTAAVVQPSADIPTGVIIAIALGVLGAILLAVTSIWAFIDFIRLLIKS